jgi:hypothetical protein
MLLFAGESWRRRLLRASMAVAFAAMSGCSGCDCDCGPKSCGPEFDSCEVDIAPSTGSFGAAPPCEECGADCCFADEVCVNGQCAVVDTGCHGASDCPEGWICDFGSRTLSGQESCELLPPSGQCMPMPPRCEDADIDGCLELCEIPPGSMPPSLAPGTGWSGDSVAGSLAVLPLEDDNCDGVVDEHDGARVLAMSASDGILRAFALDDSRALVETWASSEPNDPFSLVAAVRLEDGGDARIAVCTTSQSIRAYDASGVAQWESPISGRCGGLAIADLEGDGTPDVVSESQVVEAGNGYVKFAYGPVAARGFVVMDVRDNGEGRLEIVTGAHVYDHTGNIVADTGLAEGYVGVGDIDDDGSVEIVVIDPLTARLALWRYAEPPEVVRSAVDLHAQLPQACAAGSPGELESGGPPVLADVTGDGMLDVGVATARGYVLFDGALLLDTAMADVDTIAWSSAALDCDGGQRGSTAFDFDGDARAEVLAGGDAFLQLRDADGNTLASFCSTTEAGQAHPIVADLDGDGFGELLAPSSSRGAASCAQNQKTTGIALFDPLEAITRTRATHNEFGYRVANVKTDGRLALTTTMAPMMRANPATRDAPDVMVEWRPCGASQRVTVKNVGRAPLGAGQAQVDFTHEVTDELLGSIPLAVTLGPGASIDVELLTTVSGPIRADVVGASGECRIENNTATHYCP